MSEMPSPVLPQLDEDQSQPTVAVPGAHDGLDVPEDQRQAEIAALERQFDQSPSEEPENEQLHIAIGHVEDVRAMARDAADARIAAETQGGGFKGFVRRIWKGNIAQPYYQKKYEAQEVERIRQTGNVHVAQGGSVAESEATKQSIISRLTHSHAEELIREKAGEKISHLEREDNPQAAAVKEALFGLIDGFAEGKLDESNFEEEKNRVLTELAKENPDLFGEGILFADNLLEIAQNVTAKVRHDRGVRDILESAKIDIGRVKTSVNTEARFTATDKVIDKIQKSKLGSLFNESTIVTGASIIASVTKFTVQKGVAKAAAITGGLGLGAGIMAGARESKRIKEERRQHSRERAMGQEFADAGRRSEIETARYETRSATELIDQLNSFFEEGDEELKKIKDLDAAGFTEAARIVAEIKLRNQLADERGIDLIHFSDAASVEQERFELALTTIYTERALERLLEEKGGIDWLKGNGLNNEVHDFAELIELHKLPVMAEIDQDMSEKDRVFRRIQREHVLKAAMIGGTVGLVLGTASQEALAHIPGIGDHLTGIGEKSATPGDRSTLLHGLFNREGGGSGNPGDWLDVNSGVKVNNTDGIITGHNPDGSSFVQVEGGHKVNILLDNNGHLSKASLDELHKAGFDVNPEIFTPKLSGEIHDVAIGNNTLKLPVEYSAQETSPYHWTIFDASGKPVTEVPVYYDGSFSQESFDILQTHGITGHVESNIIGIRTEVPGLGADDIVKNHLADTTKVHRVLWYGNDTPSKYDLNELLTHAGGPNGSWYDAQGNVVLDVSKMTEAGSFWGDQSANPFALTGEGKLSLAVSASRGTQANVFDFKFSTLPDGRTVATIPPDSPVHQLFKMEGGRRVFNGGYFEVMEHTGALDSQGEQVKILGTFVGKNDAGNLTDVIDTTQKMYTTTLNIPTAPENIEVISFRSPLVEAAPVIPIRARRGLESPMVEVPYPESQPSNELELYRGEIVPVVPRGTATYVSRDILPYTSSNEVDTYRRFFKTIPKDSKQSANETDQNKESVSQQPETKTYKLNGNEYSAEQMNGFIDEYISSLNPTSPLQVMLSDDSIKSADEFVEAVEARIEELNQQLANNEINERQLRIELMRLFPDHNVLSQGRIVTYNQRARFNEPSLTMSGPASYDVLRLMFQNYRRNR